MEENNDGPVIHENMKEKNNIIVDKVIMQNAQFRFSYSSSLEARMKIEDDIVYDIFDKYGLKSIIQIGCGALSETYKILFNLTQTIEDFKYFGCDLNEDFIEMNKKRFKHVINKWTFEKLNFIEQPLPDDYDLILSRTALMHLSIESILDTFHVMANAKQAKYLLVTSNFVKKNSNPENGRFRHVNLLIHPFNLTKYVDVFHLNKKKMFILYDIPNYLSKIDFKSIKNQL